MGSYREAVLFKQYYDTCGRRNLLEVKELRIYN